jgi:hypothetical protein
MHRNYDYLYFLKEALFTLNSFCYLFYKNIISDRNTKKNFYLGYFFKTAINNYTKGFFLNVRPFVYNKLFRFVKLLRKFYKKNKRVRERVFKVLTKYSKPNKPRFKYIKHSKNYKGKKKFRKVRLPERTINVNSRFFKNLHSHYKGKKNLRKLNKVRLFSRRINLNTRFFRNLHYKKNKMLPFLIRRGINLSRKTKFIKLYNFINDLSIKNRGLEKAMFLLKTAKNSIYLQFNKNINKFNRSYSKDERKLSFLRNLSGNSLNIDLNEKFFTNSTKSVYRFNTLVSRYSTSYFFR